MKTKLETLIEEANAQAKEHPSKDARYFANSVHKYLTTLAQPEQDPATIWYMRDNHTFKKLSADVSTALIEIEQEFNEGYTYGMLCSKRKGFPTIHASGEKKRLEFFAECKKTLEEWLPNTTPPQRPRVVFPTMLRQMWSGGEVQAWLDENVNKENT